MVALAVRTYGESGRQLLLIHGLGSNSEGWWRVGPVLAEAGFAVTAPDLRGHGASDHATEYSFDAYAEDVASLGDNWDVVIAHSLGGSIALTLFDRDPQFGRRLVLLDPALVLPEPDVAVDVLSAAYESPLTASQLQIDNPTWHAEDARIKAEALRQSSRSVSTQTVLDNPGWNVVAQASRLTVPTLLVGSDPSVSSLVPTALGEGLAELNPHIRFIWIPASSHSIHRDEFEPLMTELLEFVA